LKSGMKLDDLLKSEGVWRSVVKDAPYGIVIMDREGNVLFINDFSYPGLSPEQIVGKNIRQLMRRREWEKVMGYIEKVFQTGTSILYESKEVTAQDTSWYLTRIGPLRDHGKTIGITMIYGNITDRKHAEEALRKAHDELERRVQERTKALSEANELLQRQILDRIKAEEALKAKSHELEEINTALRVLLAKREEDKRELEEKVLLNVKTMALPYIEKLERLGLSENHQAYIGILLSNLSDIVSPFSRNLSSGHSGLTPNEIQVANLVKEGKTSKEIAEMMALSIRTIEAYRDSIRKKLGLKNRKINLRSHLRTLSKIR
jgi:PAS domain S-box-containing protein